MPEQDEDTTLILQFFLLNCKVVLEPTSRHSFRSFRHSFARHSFANPDSSVLPAQLPSCFRTNVPSFPPSDSKNVTENNLYMISRGLWHFLLLVVLICPTSRSDPYRFLALSKHFLTSSGFFATAYCQYPYC